MTQEITISLKLSVLTVAVWGAVWLGFDHQPQRVVNAADSQAKTGEITNDKLVWLDDYEAGLKEAKATGKPIFLEFRCAP